MSNPTQPTPRLLTLAEVSARTGLHRNTLRRRIHDGTIPAVFLARRFRVREDDLTAWIESHKA